MTEPIRIAVVGHTNAGKTSLLRTLTRRVNFGEVSQQPGTTRHVEAVELQVNGRAAVRFFDTPGLEDAVALREHLAAFDDKDLTPPERVRRFLQGPEAHGVFEQEAKVLRALLEVDAAFLVIDAREPVLPKFRAEIELLNACARPVLPVLNFVRDAANREAAWKELLSAYGLHVVVRFDAAAPFVGAERELYRDLATLLRDRRAQLDGVAAFLEAEFASRRQAAATRIAELLVDAAAMRRSVSAVEFAIESSRQRLIAALQKAVFDKAQRCADDLLALYGFREGDADEAPLPMVEGRWTMDFFHPEALKDASVLLGKGVAVGAAVGVVADLALHGLSLGAGAALGGAIGGAVSQGLGPLGRKLANKLRDVHELTVEDRVLFVIASWQLKLLRALEQRGHAAVDRIAAGTTAGSTEAAQRPLAELVRAAQPARSHPDWESSARLRWREAPQRQDVVARVAERAVVAIEKLAPTAA
jgi:GTPase Era involved in 16S rRNA processing